jgi:hypothetical protein
MIIHPLNLCVHINKTINSLSIYPIEHAKTVIDEMHKFLRAWNKSPNEYKSIIHMQTPALLHLGTTLAN